MLEIRKPSALDLFGNFGQEIDKLSRLSDEMFHFHGLPTLGENNRNIFSPSLDFIEKENNFEINIETPGIEKDNIDITIDKDILTIKGEKKYERIEEKEEVHINERFFGSFRRQINLPINCDKEKINAKYNNGILILSLPKIKEKENSIKKIEIK